MELNRREVVQAMTIAGAGLAFTKSVFAQGAAPAAAAAAGDLNVAIIGAGTQGRVLIEGALNVPGVKFKAVCDMWAYSSGYASRALKAKGHPVNVYEDYREMLDKEKDLHAVIVATPDFMHAEHAIAAMKAGLHVYCEKEMSNTVENAKKIALAAKETGKCVQIGHQRRSNPVYKYALELINKTGIIGRLTNCYGQWNRPVQEKLTCPPKYVMTPETLAKYGFESMDHFRNWRWFKKYSAGPIADLGSHQIDIFSWFAGCEPSGVMASGSTDYYKDREWFNDVMAIYEYPGKQGSIRGFYQVLNTNGYGNYFERFYGDKGTLTISESAKMCYYVPDANYQPPEWMAGVENITADGYQAIPLIKALAKKDAEAANMMSLCEQKTIHQWHLENFFDAVKANDKTKLNCPADVAYATAVAVLNTIPAIEAGKKVVFTAADYVV